MGRNRSRAGGPTAVARLAAWVNPHLLAITRHLATRAGMLAALTILVAIGLRLTERAVHAMPRFSRVPTLEWVQLPDWLAEPRNRAILQRITESAGLSVDDRVYDPTLTRRIGERLSRPENGWVARVRQVKARPDGVVRAWCDFRRPVAWVSCETGCYLLADDGVRLPGSYGPAVVCDSSLVRIVGVAGEPPAVGQRWASSDLVAGLKVLTCCADRPFVSQIVEVDVGNHHGRRSRVRPQLELKTDRAARVLWGRTPGEEDGCEIPADRKVALLETLYRRFGRIDLNVAFVNVMNWPDRVGLPAGSEIVASR